MIYIIRVGVLVLVLTSGVYRQLYIFRKVPD